ncbi:MAG: prepilin-type N-terminal cleavage/methylation domain-containing protein [Bacilli bacterium]|nr:prepilin-type N-terminal cleavage/methylation domain-containing protein [Bacilli bacterium]
MEKINRKRLNNKGFTLIELLAVVVILAVVMGIAMTSVLSSMNNSRKGSLQNSAKKVSQALQTKYSEAMVTNSTTDVYGDVLGTNDGFDFSVSSFTIYTIPNGLKDEMNLSPSTYVLDSAANTIPATGTNTYTASTSFVAFDGDTMVVCLFAKQGGSYYVGDATKAAGTVTIGSNTITMDTDTTSTTNADMWACSTDGTQSW